MAGVRHKPSTSGRYQGFFIDQTGKKKYFTGTTKRSETLRIARKLEDDHRQIRLGYREPSQTHLKHRGRPFMEAVAEYLAWGRAQGGHKGRAWATKHAYYKSRHLTSWAQTLELKTLGDLDGLLPRVEATIRELAARGKTGKTIGNLVEALRSLCNWLVIRGYLQDNPLAKLSKIDTTPRSQYRALSLDETQRLLKVAAPHLKILYVIAMVTGLRAGELRSLTRRHLDTVNMGLKLDPAWTKNRKAGFQPLPHRLVKELETFAGSGLVPSLYAQFFRQYLCPPDALLYVPSHPARELDKDLIRAGIPKKTAEGKIAFHALRTAFVTFTYEAGATHREAQELARHSTPHLTANIYGRARNDRLAGITEKVADAVLSGNLGANMVHQLQSNVTPALHKPLLSNGLTGDEGKSGRQDLNLRPLRPERSALSQAELLPGRRNMQYSTRREGLQAITSRPGRCQQQFSPPDGSVGRSAGW